MKINRYLINMEQKRPVRFFMDMYRRYQEHDVARRSAAMAYYLLFTIFPLLIFISSVVGLLKLDVMDVTAFLDAILPDTVVELCTAYLTYVSSESSPAILWFSLVFSIYFPARAAGCLMEGVRLAYGQQEPENRFLYYTRVLLFTVILIGVIVASLFLITIGERMLVFLGGVTFLGRGLIGLWNGMRFLFLGLILFTTLGLLYALSQNHRAMAREILPGALASLVAWMLFSVGFSYYVEYIANYSVIYGTLGAVVILMIWLNLSAAVLFLGAECNGVLNHWRRRPRPGR